MPIELITGLPGNAKTLHALERVIDRSSSENRPVYYAGIKEFINDDPRLKGVPWTEFDPMKWHEDVPSGALIVIDEAQKVFRSRSLGSVPGKHVTELEEHRHKGLDFYMITQHPSLIDPAIRKLTQTHRHMMRVFGMSMSTIHTWHTGVKENCEKPGGRKDSEKTKWAFNKKLYGIYKSADVHTIKAKIPARVYMLGALVLLFAAAVWYMVGFLSKKTTAQPGGAAAAQTVPNPMAGPSPGVVQPAGSVHAAFDPVEDARHYVEQETPRLAGLPHTAPKYDEITRPVRAPVPAACIQVGSVKSGKTPDCKCYSQKGTPMPVEYNMCISIANNGYFLDFDPEPKEQGREGVQAASAAPAPVQASDGSGGGRVLSLAALAEPSKISGRPQK